jgi:hypothetical protein
MAIRERACNSIQLAQDREQWQTVVNMVMNRQVPSNWSISLPTNNYWLLKVSKNFLLMK